MLKYVIAAVVLVSATPAAASETDWTYIATTDSGTVVRARTVDLERGRSNQTAAPVWLYYDASRDKTVSFRDARGLSVVNCVTRTTTEVQGIAYYRDGRVEHSDRGPTTFIVPDSIMDQVANVLCADPQPEPNYR